MGITDVGVQADEDLKRANYHRFTLVATTILKPEPVYASCSLSIWRMLLPFDCNRLVVLLAVLSVAIIPARQQRLDDGRFATARGTNKHHGVTYIQELLELHHLGHETVVRLQTLLVGCLACDFHQRLVLHRLGLVGLREQVLMVGSSISNTT